jgi:cellulose biosynthesis protein BcsQ
VLGVLQAEVLGARSFQGLLKYLEQFSLQGRPRLGGIVVNMFQYQQGASSYPAVHDALRGLPADIVMQPAIPRDPVLLEASAYGVPVALLDEQSPSALAGIFDSLAADLSTRLGVSRVSRRKVIGLVD